MGEKLLSIHNLRTYFFTYRGIVKAVDGVNLEMEREDTLGLVGETGSGKSVTAISVMRLVPPPGSIIDGEIMFDGENLLEKSDEDMRKIRGSKIAMIFQDPMTSLNPVLRIGHQVAEVLVQHQGLSRQEALQKTYEMLTSVAIPDASRIASNYPHQLSGGMRQRVMIAMALACQPDLLISDEATTSLDVTIEAQILELMKDLKKKAGSSILWITHNLGVIAEICNKVAVMYAGDVVEYSDVVTLFEKPRHPYTLALLASIPRVDYPKDILAVIPGTVPDLVEPPQGCSFHPRCRWATVRCTRHRPKLTEVKPGHLVACHDVASR